MPDFVQQGVRDLLARQLPPAPPSPPPPNIDTKGQQWARALLLALGAGLDIDSTRRALANGATESNTWLYGAHPSVGRMLAVKGAINIPLAYLFHMLADSGSKREALGLAALTGGAQAVVAANNYANAGKR